MSYENISIKNSIAVVCCIVLYKRLFVLYIIRICENLIKLDFFNPYISCFANHNLNEFSYHHEKWAFISPRFWKFVIAIAIFYSISYSAWKIQAILLTLLLWFIIFLTIIVGENNLICTVNNRNNFYQCLERILLPLCHLRFIVLLTDWSTLFLMYSKYFHRNNIW